MAQRKFTVVLRPGDDGYVVAECPAFVGCISQGRDRDEALRNIAEAIQLCIDGGETPTGELVEVDVSAA